MGRLVCTFMDMAEEVREIIMNSRGDTMYTRMHPDEYPWQGDNDNEEYHEEDQPHHLQAD